MRTKLENKGKAKIYGSILLPSLDIRHSPHLLRKLANLITINLSLITIFFQTTLKKLIYVDRDSNSSGV